MKICFIVLAHHQPVIFHKLIDHLSNGNSDIIVHIDKRSDLREFVTPGQENVHFIKARKKVYWGGWSLTKTICRCIEYGLDVSDADYFMYLAGTDFPIKPVQATTDYLSAQHPANFLNYYPLVPGIWGYGLIEYYKLMDLRARFLDVRHDGGPARVSGTNKIMAALANRSEHFLNTHFLPREQDWINFYSGSSRWCLNRKTAHFLIDYLHSPQSRRLRRYLRLATNSDEIFFQTAILNSDLKKFCPAFDEAEAVGIFARKRPAMPDEKRVYLHYIDWNPEREDPAILDESDLPRLEKSGKFFACKFTEEKSLGLIGQLEERILQQ